MRHHISEPNPSKFEFLQIWGHITEVIVTFLIFVVGKKLKNLQKGLFVSFSMPYLSVLTDG